MPTATAADAGRAARRWPGTTLADLHRGRELYIARCSSCHQPVAPGSIAARDWPGHVREMQERANLEPGPAELVVRYLVTMSAARNR
jgi:cytochrome c